MKDEYCQSCGNILRFPESARKVICDSCDSEWIVVRTGDMISLAPVGTMQTIGQEDTLQKRLKDIDRQIRIKDENFQRKKKEVDSIKVEFKSVPMGFKLGALIVLIFFNVGAAGAWFFRMPLPVSIGMVVLSVAPIPGIFIYKRQINQGARQKLLEKKELLQEMGLIKKEIEDLKAGRKQAAENAVIEE